MLTTFETPGLGVRPGTYQRMKIKKSKTARAKKKALADSFGTTCARETKSVTA
jgi:hypothetical protein